VPQQRNRVFLNFAFLIPLMQKIKSILSYFQSRIWDVRLEDRSSWSAFLFKQLRIILIVSKNFNQNKLQVQAAGLTFYTLLSVVPVVALVFAIAKGFGMQEALENQIFNSMKGQEAAAEQIMLFARRMLDSTQGGLLAVVGVAILLWSVLTLLSSIEASFNDIWQVAKGRSWIKKITDYFIIMFFAPILIIASGSMQVVLTQGFENLVTGFDVLTYIGPVVFFFIKMVPYVLIWLVFTFVYIVMPNTKVNFSSALIAGIIAGTSFILVQWVYIYFQVGVSRYNAIYGSFAALPLFMIWANTSWLITLIGAEVAYANQNVSQIENEVDGNRLSSTQIHVIAMMLCKRISASFMNGDKPLSAKTLSSTLRIPFGVTNKVLEILVEAKILTEVEQLGEESNAFLPIRSFETITVSDLMRAIDTVNYTSIPTMASKEMSKYFILYDNLRDSLKTNAEDCKVRELPDLT
jgi:membrane protein